MKSLREKRFKWKWVSFDTWLWDPKHTSCEPMAGVNTWDELCEDSKPAFSAASRGIKADEMSAHFTQSFHWFHRKSRKVFANPRNQWREPNKPPVSQPEAKPPANSWPPKPPASRRPPPEVWRNPIVIGPEPLPSERSVVTRSRLNCWSESFRSSDWFVRSLRTSRLTSDSSRPLLWLFRRYAMIARFHWMYGLTHCLCVCIDRRLRLIWSDSSRTPICAPFTPREWQLCRKTSNWPVVSVERELKTPLLSITSYKRPFLGPIHTCPLRSWLSLPYFLYPSMSSVFNLLLLTAFFNKLILK